MERPFGYRQTLGTWSAVGIRAGKWTLVRVDKPSGSGTNWCGINVGESRNAILREPGTLVLSSGWTGEIRDHTDLLLELHREWSFFIFPRRYFCEALKQGTLVVLPESEEVVVGGATPRDYKVYNSASSQFSWSDKSISVAKAATKVRIHNAFFTVAHDA